jgi:hypothetical protein
MKRLHIFASALVLLMMTVANAAVADSGTWVETVQEKIASLDLSGAQKMDIGKAFDSADMAYEKAFGDARKIIGETLTDDQKKSLGDMANAQLQKRLEGDMTARTKSIADIAKDLGVTDSQSEMIKKALGGLGDTLDGIDAGLIKGIKSVLNPDQLAKIASWIS